MNTTVHGDVHGNTFAGVDVVDGILLWFRSDRKTGRLGRISMLLEHDVSTMILILSLKWRLKMRSYMQFDAFTEIELIRTLMCSVLFGVHDPHTGSCILLKGGHIMRQGRPASRRSRYPVSMRLWLFISPPLLPSLWCYQGIGCEEE